MTCIISAVVCIFKQVITNEGEGYNRYTGVFSCTEAGVYVFFVSTGGRGVGQVISKLVVNGEHAVDMVIDPAIDTQDILTSNMAILRLKQGDAVWVLTPFANVHVMASDSYRYTTFSGFYLHP